MLPKAVVTPFEFVVQALAAFALHEAFALTGVRHDNDAQLRVDFSLAIPVATGGADFDFSRDNQFLVHGHINGWIRQR